MKLAPLVTVTLFLLIACGQDQSSETPKITPETTAPTTTPNATPSHAVATPSLPADGLNKAKLPSADPDGSESSTRATGPSSPISVILTVSQANESPAVSRVSLRLTTISAGDADNVTVALTLSEGLTLLQGEQMWVGDLQRDIPVSIDYQVEALEPGNWNVHASAKWQFTPDSWYGGSDTLCLSVGGNSIETDRGPCPTETYLPTGINESKTNP